MIIDTKNWGNLRKARFIYLSKNNIDFFPELVPFPVYDIFIFYKLLNVFFLFHDRFLAMGNLRDASHGWDKETTGIKSAWLSPIRFNPVHHISFANISFSFAFI